MHALEKLSQSINRWIEPLLFGIGPPEQAEAFRKEFDLSFPIVCDPDRRLYAAYPLNRVLL